PRLKPRIPRVRHGPARSWSPALARPSSKSRLEWRGRPTDELLALGDGCGLPATAQKLIDPHRQLLGWHRLRQDLVEPNPAESIHLIFGYQSAECDEDRVLRALLLLEDFHRLEATDRRHHKVEKDEVGRPVTRCLQSFVRRRQGSHIVPGALQYPLMHRPHSRIIIDDEDAALPIHVRRHRSLAGLGDVIAGYDHLRMDGRTDAPSQPRASD